MRRGVKSKMASNLSNLVCIFGTNTIVSYISWVFKHEILVLTFV